MDGTLPHYKNYVKGFPIMDQPDIFGLHENATIMREHHESKKLLSKVFEMEYASKEIIQNNEVNEDNEDMLLVKYASVKTRIQRIIAELPELLDEDTCREKYPISYEECINNLLIKEASRLNQLLQVIYISLRNTLQALDGVTHITQVLEDIYFALTYEHVPKRWFKYCYPTFTADLPLFLANLRDRVEFFRGWIAHGHPVQYWLPGFFD